MLEDGDDLAIGKARGIHVELPVPQVENSTSDLAFFVGGLPGLARLCSAQAHVDLLTAGEARTRSISAANAYARAYLNYGS